MRASWLVILATCLITGCVVGPSAAGPSPAVRATDPATIHAVRCSTGYANRIDIHLSNSDDGRSITARLCDAIEVVLLGRPSWQWQSIDSSDEAVLEVVPLPLPAPPPGGAHNIYLAQETGAAVLSSVAQSTQCASQANSCRTDRWAVRVTVTG